MGKVRFTTSFIFCFLFSSLSVFSQNSSAQYQVPQTIYVGDKGKLIYPISQFSGITPNAKISLEETDNEDGYGDGDETLNTYIIIRNMELDKGAKNLIIEFQAYRTGTVSVPPIIIGEQKLSGLQVHISSLIEAGNSTMVLSAPAAPLASEGTFFIITTIILGVILVFLLIYFFWKHGFKLFLFLNTNAKAFFLIYSISIFIKHLQKNLAKDKIEHLQAIRDLSSHLRIFFSKLLDIQCTAMVSDEFLSLEIPYDNKEAVQGLKECLCDFFKKGDSLRFSGEAITSDSVNDMISLAKNILETVKKIIK
ncbi:MAG: hypothetical protein Ta2G_00320 [Termitinemataceae bacterium]|nr:MAG: hypothetical protein Ta2G_00320 [Termitinemataceae bacterium]